MTDRDRIVLLKILGYIREATEYIRDLDFESFMRDRKTISASAFCIGQIGELSKEVSDDTQHSNPEIPWNSIRGMRNKIIHDYESTDFTVLWGTLTESLPELTESINRALLAEDN